LLVATDPDDATAERRILAVTKSNLAAIPPALAYTLQPATNDTAYVQWEGATTHTARQLLSFPEDDEERGAKTDAMDVLRTILADGPKSAADVKREAAQAGVAERTLRRAKDTLGVTVRKDGYQGQWLWDLTTEICTEVYESPKMAKDDQRRPHKNDGHLWENVDTFDSPQAGTPFPTVPEDGTGNGIYGNGSPDEMAIDTPAADAWDTLINWAYGSCKEMTSDVREAAKNVGIPWDGSVSLNLFAANIFTTYREWRTGT